MNIIKQKSKLITGAILAGLVLFMAFIFFLTKILTGQTTPQTSIAPQKTKAASISYSKFVLLNQSQTNPTNTPTPTPTLKPEASPTGVQVSPTGNGGKESQSAPSPSVTSGSTLAETPTNSPTPTKIKLNASLTPTDIASSDATISPTAVKSLPITGNTFGSLVIFGISTAVVFFSFLF